MYFIMSIDSGSMEKALTAPSNKQGVYLMGRTGIKPVYTSTLSPRNSRN